MRVKFKPSKLNGDFTAPPSKSFAHRAIISAALSGGTSRIFNISKSEDILATLDCISALGASFSEIDGGIEILGITNSKNAVFPCRESGSTLRFIFPIALSLCDNSVFTGSKRLIERGIDVYEDIFTKKGIEISKTDTEISAFGRLVAGNYEVLGNISSQYISGLLFALPLLDGDSRVTVIPPFESKPYVDITVSVMEKFGVKTEKEGENCYLIKGNQKYSSCDTEVEGDWSNSAVFFALNALGSDISISGLDDNSLQGDKIITEYIKEIDKSEPKIDLSLCPDLAPVLFALSAAKGGGEFSGTKRLKIKESDRAAAMKAELLKFGIKTEIFDNRVRIFEGKLKVPDTVISSHNDHRIVMAMSLLLTQTGGEIDGAEAVSKSFPDFFKVLKSLGAEVSYED